MCPGHNAWVRTRTHSRDPGVEHKYPTENYWFFGVPWFLEVSHKKTLLLLISIGLHCVTIASSSVSETIPTCQCMHIQKNCWAFWLKAKWRLRSKLFPKSCRDGEVDRRDVATDLESGVADRWDMGWIAGIEWRVLRWNGGWRGQKLLGSWSCELVFGMGFREGFREGFRDGFSEGFTEFSTEFFGIFRRNFSTEFLSVLLLKMKRNSAGNSVKNSAGNSVGNSAEHSIGSSAGIP